ncbi:MAG: hypothetical protein ACRC14_18640, partial [Paracoccaceae bacterium]
YSIFRTVINMSDFGYQPPRFSLMDQKLTLSPDVTAIIAQIEAEMAAKAWMDQILSPNWELSTFQNLVLLPPPVSTSPPNPFLTTPPVPTPTPPPAPTVNPFPADPRPGEMKDIAKAIYKLPVVQGIVQRAKDEGEKQLRALRTEFKKMPTGEKVASVSFTAVVAAGFIAPIIANKETRLLAFDFLKNNDIPVPGVKGFSFKLLDHGGGVGVPLFVPGLGLKSSLEIPGQGDVNFNATVNWDIAAFIDSRFKK